MKTTTTETKLETASRLVREAEEKGMSQSTINRRYRELFAIEDAIKASGAWQ
jgi:hypothetical protein